MATIDQQFVEYIVKTLVNKPDKVVVERKIDERGVLLSLTVDPDDIGRVIGRRGVTAQSLRMLLRALGTKQDARFNLKIVNSDGENDNYDGGHSGGHNKKWHDTEPTAVEEVREKIGGDGEEVEYNEEIDESDDTDAEDTDEEDADEEEASSGESSEFASKTRAEMADLDDLDI